MPGFIVAVALWTKAVGFSLIKIRALSICFGFAGILLWYWILGALRLRQEVRLLAVALLAVNFIYLRDATYGRADMMSLACGAAGLAAYLRWREENLSLALLVSQAAIAVSGLTHPNGGLLSLMTFLVFAFGDRKRLRWRHLAAMAAPYAVGAALWGAYIAQAPQVFLEQFSSNTGSRFGGILHPFQAIWDEVTKRYLVSYGLGTDYTEATPRLVFLKSASLLLYIISVAVCLGMPSVRKQSGARGLLAVLGLQVAFLTFCEGVKNGYYLVWLMPVFSALAALAFFAVWNGRRGWRIAMLAVLLCSVAVEGGASLAKARQSPGMRAYHRAVEYLREHGGERSHIFASSEFGYAFGFAPHAYEDDVSLGQWSGMRPDLVVYSHNYASQWFLGAGVDRTGWRLHASSFLKNSCRLALDQPFYPIYECR